MAIEQLPPAPDPQPGSPMSLGHHEPLLVEAAVGHHGMFTTDIARHLGLDKFALAALTAGGHLIHPCRGLYAVAELVDQGTDTTWHKHLTYGGRMLYPDATLVGATSLVAHDITVWNTDLTRPAFFRPRDRSAAASAFWVRPRVCPNTIDTPWGPTQTIADSLIQHCLDNGMTQGVVSVDAALRSQLTTVDELVAAAERVEKWPRSHRVRSMLTHVDGRHESPGESLTAVFAGASGIELVPQVTIFDEKGRFIGRVDFVVKGTRVVVEFDGKRKYFKVDGDDDTGPWGKPVDERVLEEKQREDRLRAQGYVVVRLIWRDFYSPGVVAAKIRAGLALEQRIYSAR
ncbi:MAG: type IV toxin-antitoxin system AbiEi family antitoxin domain-containing protein [Intrasporangiaceae bacterium]|nr:type IV toxin-antitoxin system AbiEi family antitoxin domain-containing protein [Intrasporangiaceae bacterium]